MSKDQAIGTIVLLGSIAGILAYAWLLYSFTIVVLQLTAFLAVAALLAILAWIGWTMAMTPPLEPVDYAPSASTALDGVEKKDNSPDQDSTVKGGS